MNKPVCFPPQFTHKAANGQMDVLMQNLHNSSYLIVWFLTLMWLLSLGTVMCFLMHALHYPKCCLHVSPRYCILNIFHFKCMRCFYTTLYKFLAVVAIKKKKETTLSDDGVCLSTSLPQYLRESLVSLKAFMLFQKFRSSCCLQSESSLNCEVSGREKWFRVGTKARDRPEARALWNTKIHSCVWTASQCSTAH